MSKKETPLTRYYWQNIIGKGLLIEEFQLIKKSENNSYRLADGLIVLNEEFKIHTTNTFDIKGKEVILLQTKSSTLGMYLAGQTFISKLILEKYHQPKNIRAVSICLKDDIIIRNFLEDLCCEVYICNQN